MKRISLLCFALLTLTAVEAQKSKKAKKVVAKVENTAEIEKKKAEEKAKLEALQAEKMHAEAIRKEEEQAKMNGIKPPPPPAPTQAPAAPQVDVNKVFEFKNDSYDFGKIVGGKPVEYVLYIKNISKDSAELTHVQAGCGCTTPRYTAKQKFAPGQTAEVSLGFNGGAAGSASPFQKYVTVTLNGNLTKQVTFKGETYAVPAEPAPANKVVEGMKPAQ